MAFSVAAFVSNMNHYSNNTSVTIPVGYTPNSDGSYCPPGYPYYFPSADSCSASPNDTGQSYYPTRFTPPTTTPNNIVTTNNNLVTTTSNANGPTYSFDCRENNAGPDGYGGTWYDYVNFDGQSPEGTASLPPGSGNTNPICFTHWQIGYIGELSYGCGAQINGQLQSAPPNLWNVKYWDDAGNSAGIEVVWFYFADGASIELLVCSTPPAAWSSNTATFPQTCDYVVNGRLAVNPANCEFQGGSYPTQVMDWG
jgi:hypothetical protein